MTLDKLIISTVKELEAQLEAIKQLMQRNLLTQAQIDNPYYGEDGNIYSFELGQPYGAHDLAEEVLTLMGVEIVLEPGEAEDDEDADE